ncbi:DMT family transporter [Cytobacillus purgationiresistens]|uniref:Drug/metabolite transporter (DMT)-like permease n=1 Tax=Cytobacillus purgationiresistens TaxID=863449 RepID=A0ABU0ADE5_9BACI|nr:multidrug resistance efflux transporter family protein [Cytobacillus purgationiresistens]MDQ0269276.1 drug/metabolite transporter (DMT)-like permease [Cytobacillus purgationiresistens]
MKAIILGIFAAFFFAFTFILNSSMEMDGGSWFWSASLRYLFMIPMLLVIVACRRNLRQMFAEMKRAPRKWLIWSFVGFGLFYAPICFAAAYGPGWLIAGTWQITIISGSLLAPLFYETIHTKKGPIQIKGKIPYRGLMMSLIILLGVFIMQFEHASKVSLKETLLCVIPIIIASIAYPLGNRKMMEVTNNRLDAYQRVLGMTIASLPFWFILAAIGLQTSGIPSAGQVYQSGLVALLSGVFATVLFFAATDLVQGNMQKLGAVEATQSLEVLFAVAGEVIFLSSAFPSNVSLAGMGLVMLGMALHSYVSTLPVKP